ncbi:MAG: hypothetical protein ABFR50_08280 [Candidatus Fermentibacteria bacterium]
MRSILVLIMLTCTLSVVAGDIVIGICAECGCQTDEFFAGYGMMPGYVAEIYRDNESGEYHLVRFDLIEIESEEITLTITDNHNEIGIQTAEEIAVTITNNHHEIGMQTAEEIAATITNNHPETGNISVEEITAVIRNSYAEVVEIAMIWTSPEVLGEISLNGVLPAGAHLNDELTGDPLNWKLVSLYDGPHQCPGCCGETFEFQRIGNWD